ncbi:MAG: hypothetical protein CUN48_08445 [Candidatus Thermofonsia Clade 3 bacterium]|jgi:hypothetical protein|uniref:Glycerophosphoryl diester phosphodiesterase membrane domain-containing protein n=1 Tax=Candidatus Thermofonsia Clade 3 bacterium TaxID=2364212 RepID=A0A2M8QCD9_9CHLR|nr:hypothetical protein [Candidatus Roseilinea sp. NK_OTU-006]PJF47473.1 MAG: hypothetical protein CUN48_08445 [Candidatus Thermofonsia Clade 3 bacterium]
MDIGATLSRAFNIALKHRALWVLGFLVSLISQVNSAGSALSNSGSSLLIGPSAEAPPEVERFFNQLARDPGLIVTGLAGFLCLALLISLVLWIISIIAQGGLIGGVQQIEEEGGTTFGQAWSVGVRRFWPLFGLSLLLGLPGLLLLAVFALLLGGMFVPIIAAAVSGDESALSTAAGNAFALICCCGGALGCIGLLYAIIAAALQTFGERAIVLEQKGVMDAIRRGWEVFRSNLGSIILLALLMLVVNILVSVVIAIVGGLLFAPTLVAAILSAGNEGGMSNSSLVLVGLNSVLVVIVAAIINAIFAAFSSAVWTLAYRQFTGAGGLIAEPQSPAPLPTA